MFKSIRENAKGKGLHTRNGIGACRTIRHRTRQLSDLGNPTPVILTLGFNFEFQESPALFSI